MGLNPDGYVVEVYDAAVPEAGAPVLLRCRFRRRRGEKLAACLARADDYRVLAESVFPGRFVAVRCTWGEWDEGETHG